MRFYGVRGSCPCPSPANLRYGGNTACVVLDQPGEDPLILDLGTGLRAFGESQPLDGTFSANALLTHIHLDHVQGLPFLAAADRPGARLRIFGPEQDEGTLAGAFDRLLRPPYFPVTMDELRGEITFSEVLKDDFEVGGFEVKARPVPHLGPTVGYRVSSGGRSVAYVSDHQAPPDLEGVAGAVLELVASADVLIHDAQYTPAEFAEKTHWGHCTVGYAVEVARQAGVSALVLFHHDPSHDDGRLDELLCEARRLAGRGGPEVLAAHEGLVLTI